MKPKTDSCFRKSRLCQFVLVLSLCWFSPATGQENKLPNPISVSGAPWAFYGFVVSSPDGPEFYSAYKNQFSAAIAKKLPERDRTYALTVLSTKLENSISSADEWVEFLQKTRNKDRDSRYRMLEHIEEKFPHRDYICSRYRTKFQDSGVRWFGSVPFLSDGITCVHPEERRFAVDIGYSERAGGTGYDSSFKELGEKFVRSLRFLPWPDREEFRVGMKARMAQQGETALATFNPMIARGDNFAAMRAGEIYLSGVGVPTDYEMARKLLELAAMDGHAGALYNLGVIYDQGLGVTKNPREAMRWFRLAADQRDNEAQYNLAVYHGQGIGMPVDTREAEKWLSYAADNGNATARKFLPRR